MYHLRLTPSLLLRFFVPGLVAGLVAACVISLFAILPSVSLLGLVGAMCWVSVPGLVLARRLYGPREGGWIASVLAGPLWGYVLTSLVLLALWASGVRGVGWLATAPMLATLAVWPARRLSALVSPPAFTRRDIAPLLLALLAVPAVVGLPYARVGVDLPEGRAYRAYFTADFVWEMAVVSEVSKGDVPPRNPYFLADDLHYYWLMHLVPAIEHRAAGRALRIEPILLVNAFMIGLGFVGFFYFFVRHFVDSPWAAALACVGIIFCSSFEGIQQIWLLWQRGIPLDALRFVNIDAITGWPPIGGQRADGLQRLLLYQPQHQIGYALGFSALTLLVEARDCSKPVLVGLAGAFLGMSLLFSSVAAAMLGLMTGTYVTWRLAAAGRWKAFIPCALAAAVPIAAALAITSGLRYVDTTPGAAPLVVLGVNRLSTRALGTVIFLGFGPVLIIGLAGALAAVRRRALGSFAPVWIVLAVAAGFYFLVDIPEHQSVYVAWRASHLAFIASAALCGFAIQEWWAAGGALRRGFTALASVVALAALPMVLIDLYNTQDVWNRAMGPGFRWTVILSPDEVRGLEWIQQSTPKEARVQVEPTVRDRDTWAYVPAFAERRMSGGAPIGMIPLAKYEKVSGEIAQAYASPSAVEAYDRLLNLCVDYLVVGPPERSAYPALQPRLDATPQLFPPVFRNGALAIYAVSGSWNREGCPH